MGLWLLKKKEGYGFHTNKKNINRKVCDRYTLWTMIKAMITNLSDSDTIVNYQNIKAGFTVKENFITEYSHHLKLFVFITMY